ncbi:response regulator [bacterium]|nr:response regulator [bacterium]
MHHSHEISQKEMEMEQNKTILLADDNVQILRMLNSFFRRAGYRCKLCTCGEEAANILRNDRDIGLVLTDHKMPGNEALQMVKEIRIKYPDIKIVVMSGNYSDDTLLELKGIGVRKYLQKPLELRQLQMTIQEELFSSMAGE